MISYVISSMWNLFDRILKNQKDVSVKDLEKVLMQFWFIKKRQKWSHAHYYNKDKHIFFSFPHKKPVKEYYVKVLITLIKENYEV